MDSAKQLVECSHRSTVEIDGRKTAWMQMFYCQTPESCKLCPEDVLIKQGGAGTTGNEEKKEEEEEEEEEVVVVTEHEQQQKKNKKKKKKKKKKNKKKKKQHQQQNDEKKAEYHLCVCLECSQYFCGDGGSVPYGHVSDHWKQSGHYLVANYENPCLIYCFECKQDVYTQDVFHTSEDMGPKSCQGTQSEWIWNSSWGSDSEHVEEHKSSHSVESPHIQVSSPLSDENLVMNKSPLVCKDDPFDEPIPPPISLEPWDQQRSRNRDRRREQNIAVRDVMLLPHFWVFLDRFIRCGDDFPYYRGLLTTMIKMGSRWRELNISYLHVVSYSKKLAMDLCNGYTRLQGMMTETTREYLKELAKKLDVTESAKDLMQLELNFHGMPQMHKELESCLSTYMLRHMNVFGHIGCPIMVPLPDKCALVQSLIAHMIEKHRFGCSWHGEFTIADIDVVNGKAVITTNPKLFPIKPKISPEMIEAMGDDFKSLGRSVVDKFSRSYTYVPYLQPFIDLLSNIDSYADWWSKTTTAELLREWIEHFPFLKPPIARSNFMVGIYTASRSYDVGEITSKFKAILERNDEPWTWRVENTKNKMVQEVLHYKDSFEGFTHYGEELSCLFELLRHISQHGTEKSFDGRLPTWYGAGPAPRKQLVHVLDELEIAGSYELEKAVVDGLSKLLKVAEMDGMLKSVWECYKFCNYPYQGDNQHS